jgi:hypothetical protein
MELEQEIATFERELPRLLKEAKEWAPARQFALVKGDTVDSTWDTEADAVRAGYRLFGEEPFLVRKVEAEPAPALCLHAMVIPCPR